MIAVRVQQRAEQGLFIHSPVDWVVAELELHSGRVEKVESGSKKSQYVTSLVRLDGVELAGGNGVDKNRKDWGYAFDIILIVLTDRLGKKSFLDFGWTS